MGALDIEREIVIEAPRAVVWRTITEPDLMSQWFGDEVDVEMSPGAQGTVRFEREGAEPRVVPLFVERVESPRLFSFRWCHRNDEVAVAGNSTLVEFTLVEEGDERTRLRVSERELDLARWSDDEKSRFAEDHRAGWSELLHRLDRLVASRRHG